ncbi:MAG: hypothetical protein U1E60_08900 [Reyranellaceae bacterium]
MKFEAKGVLQLEPEAVQRIALGRGGQHMPFCAGAKELGDRGGGAVGADVATSASRQRSSS